MRIRKIIRGTIALSVVVILWWVASDWSFKTRWRKLESGMTEELVRRTLGTPNRSGYIPVIGGLNKDVTRWEYERGHYNYCVDFDYFGPVGTPLVFRTVIIRGERRWDWPSWWPWRRARAKA